MANHTVYPYGTTGQLPTSIGIINDRKTGGADKALSAQQGVEIGKIIDPSELVDIAFDGGNRYIAQATGEITSNSSWRSTQYIPVQKGDVFYYTGKPGTVSLGVGGYSYDAENDEYTYVGRIIGPSGSDLSDKLIVIPNGITHIVAAASINSTSYSLKKSVHSTLSEMQEYLGDLGSTVAKFERIENDYSSGNYVTSSGGWGTNANYRYLMVEVVPGDVIDLYDVQIDGLNVALIAKKITSSSFTPLYIPEATGTYEKITYEVKETMTLCISVIDKSAPGNPRITLIKHNKLKSLEATSELLDTTREEIATKDAEEDVLNMQLGHLFEGIAVIGDSMSRGTLSDSSDSDVDDDGTGPSSFGASWLSFLAKRWGCKRKFHYANSGTSCYKWLNNSLYGLGRMLKDATIYNAYFIAYGHNDSAAVGTAEDEAAPVTITESGGNYTVSCPDGYSFCAYYKAIINQIRTKAPHAIIFCLSEYDGVMVNSKPTYRQAVIDVADYLYENGDTLVHHLETGGVPVSGMGLGTHYSTVGYAYIAKRVDEEAGKCVYQYRTDTAIKYFGSYNTDRHADSPWE